MKHNQNLVLEKKKKNDFRSGAQLLYSFSPLFPRMCCDQETKTNGGKGWKCLYETK